MIEVIVLIMSLCVLLGSIMDLRASKEVLKLVQDQEKE